MAIKPRTGHANTESVSSLFTDRVQESAALTNSLLAMRSVLDRPEIDASALRNVLVFHGVGGVGKTRLSERLEHWIRHDLPRDVEWGAPPTTEPVHTARWNFLGLQGRIDVPTLLISIRAGVTTSTRKWPAFDLALAAYLSATRPGQALVTRDGEDQTQDMVSVLGGIANDLGASNFITSFAASSVNRLVKLVKRRFNESRQLRRFESLQGILDACELIPTGETAPHVAVDILWLLTEEVEAAAPADRPSLVVFLDHFEKLQTPETTREERTVNEFVAHLPWVLFVVTGRNQLDWHGDRDGLTHFGPDTWPQLLPGTSRDPRQHLLGNLSRDDTLHLLRRRRAEGGWRISDELLERIADQTNGWPLHIDAVLNLATNRSAELSRELTEDDLVGELPDLINRVFEDFTPEEAMVFNAACLLPFFDVPLAAAVAGTTAGAVERCIRRTLVEDNPNSLYPYRVHEEIRRLVREAGSHVKGGWSDHDWKQAAERCLTEAARRHEQATTTARAAEEAGQPRDEAPIFDALVLGLSAGLKEDVYQRWLASALAYSPSLRALSPKLPISDINHLSTHTGSLVQLCHELAKPPMDSLTGLQRLFTDGQAAARQAGLWIAYRLRSLEHCTDAIHQLRSLLDRYPDGAPLYNNQISITLRQLRRFQDAIDYRAKCDVRGTPRFLAIVEQMHGIFDQPRSLFEEHLSRQPSVRFKNELLSDLALRDVRQGNLDPKQAWQQMDRSRDLGEPSHERTALMALALLQLDHPSEFWGTIAEIRSAENRLGNSHHQVPELLTLRALLTRDEADIRRAYEAASGAGSRLCADWIRTEVWLEILGRPLDDVPEAQWLIPYEQVRENHRLLAERIIARARELA